MNRDQAYSLIRQTFTQSFDKARFRNFAINLLNRMDESKASAWNSQYVKDAFKVHVSRFERIATYTSPENEKLDVLIVHLTKESKLERARTAIRNFVADHLKTRDEKDAALVAFVSPTEKQWRFSYVKMEYATVEKTSGKVGVQSRLTPARRLSYIVGEGESCHTAQTRFVGLLQDTTKDPKLADIEGAFSVEAVTKEFFKRYVELFENIHQALEKLIKKDRFVRDEFLSKNVNAVDFSKKLMGQIVFLYFLQKKGWLGVAKGQDWGTGPRDFLRRLANGEWGKYDNFFNDILEHLFYDTLATDRGHEAWCNHFKCRIPFLNGGLFEPLGDYDWRRIDIPLANRLFTNADFVEEGITGTGVLDVFDRYNFTVNEAEPLEKEVAIDPEMLGKVFENLIEENRRKGLGAYYTPREIVHYMCQESLINYLDAAMNTGEEPVLPVKPRQDKMFGEPEPEQMALRAMTRRELVPREDIVAFVQLGDQASHYEAARMSGTKSYKAELPKSIETTARLIDEKLHDITACDPAVGSGAFLVGMMTEIVRSRSALTPYFNDVHERTPYHFKRNAIQNCLYGVDIDPGAVEIARLRLWLSLVVDEEDVKQIKPLPNLDYKVVQGNSLLGLPFKSNRLQKIERLKQELFDETRQEKKRKLKANIDQEILKCFASSKSSLGYEVNFDFELHFSEVFHNNGGFNIVIGNPPYLRVQGLQETQPNLVPVYKQKYKAACGSFDLYGLFIERGFGLLKQNGNFAYIVPHKFFRASFGKGLRALLNERRALTQIMRFGAEQVFDESTTYTCLLFLSRLRQDSFDLFEIKDFSQPDRILSLICSKQENDSYMHCQLPVPTTDDWNFHAGGGEKLLRKLRQQNLTLGDITRKIFVGLQTSLDRVYVLNVLKWGEQTVLCHSKMLEREVEIERGLVKPFLLGKNVHRYQEPIAKNVVVFPYVVENGHAKLMTPKFIRENFPLGWEYLKKNKEKMSDREHGKMRGERFYAYVYPKNLVEFEVSKIMTPDICDGPQMTLDQSAEFYHTTTLYSFVFKDIVRNSPKYFLGVLNSRLLWYFMNVTGTVLRGGFLRFKTEYLRPFPIPCSLSQKPPLEGQENRIVGLVDQILSAKKLDPEADTSKWEAKIDRMVYELYGLTEEEIAIVEGKSS
ncbi:MAG: Eco57I restriction-modification methylase domain-containing protein [Desulfobacterales bacterium]|nr:Eco57I restriction-modification methylase domain-containing protein [Desulfobacterales bacterium]MBL7172424.1 Eco57I restriction-modification methylase domain-containing protein [Desulfobacteraceae bacterium]